MPATNFEILALSVTTTAAITEGEPVGYTGAIAADAAAMAGVARTDAGVGDVLAVTVLGTGIAIAGGTIAKGAQVEVSAGKLVTQVAGVSVGRALQAAAAAGDKFEVLLLPS